MVPDQHTSRRNVLKTLGAAAAGTVAFTGSASAETDASYYCGFHMPMAFHQSDGTPVDPEVAGEVRGGYLANGIVMPNAADTPGCYGYCDHYIARIPWYLHWTTDADPSDVGDVIFNVEARTPNTDADVAGNSQGIILENTSRTLSSDAAGGGRLECKFSTIDDVGAANYFRPTFVRVELDFTDSSIRDGTVSEEFKLCTPNRSLVNQQNLVSFTDTMYDTFVKTADRVVPAPLSKLRKATRTYAYAGATGDLNMLDPASNELAYEAMRSGIAAFEGPIEDQATSSLGSVDDAVTTMGGPAMIELDEPQGCSGPPVVTNDCPTDPDGDGLYEDVNGDGTQNLADAGDLFQNRNSPAVQNNVDAYDFSGNGQIDLADTVELFDENSN